MTGVLPLGGLFAGCRDPSSPTQYGRVYVPDAQWLAKAAHEDILEPELPIVDAHHHLWDLPGFRYLLDEFVSDLQSGHNIVASVFNECQSMYRAHGPAEMKSVGEVEFCAGLAAMSESGKYGPTRVNAGIVGAADLTLGDRLAGVLEANIAAGGGRFRGVRHAAAWDSDPTIGSHTKTPPGLYLHPSFQAGMRRMTALGLSLDAWLFHTQLADVAVLARACPDANIVLCHTGGPLGYGPYADRRDEVFKTWKAGMAEIARCENISVKLGGLTVRQVPYDYGTSEAPITSLRLAEIWRPYVLTCIELFGPRRCMVESNFPVEKMGIGYAGLFNTFKRILGDLSASEKNEVFSGCASRVYRLGERPE